MRQVKVIAITLIFGLLSQGCAPAIVIASLSPEREQAHQAREAKRIAAETNRCNYDAVTEATGQLLCLAGDCACHWKLVETTMRRAAESCGTAFRSACIGPETVESGYILIRTRLSGARVDPKRYGATPAQLDAYAAELDAAIDALDVK